jgi:ribosomal protein S18 acetylase RimI-like enzyme
VSSSHGAGHVAEEAALQRVTTHEELLALSGGSGFLRWDIPSRLSGPAYRVGEAFALHRQTHTRRHGLLVMGPPEDVDRLLAQMLAADLLHDALGSVTVQRGSLDAVARHLPLGEGNDWEWLRALEPPPAVAAEGRLDTLDQGDAPVIRALLDLANPGTDARPFEYPDQRWVGVRDDDGSLLACGVREPNLAGHPVLSGITAHPSARGTGLGLAVTARLTRDAVEETGVCTLGMYSHNDVARRLYTGLGYGDTHAWSSRRLRRA